MPKGSPELTEARKVEIMEACKKIYETKTFKEVNLKEIGEVTSFTRTSIYNYFESKEEIFLRIFEDEYLKWTTDLQEIIDEGELCRDKLAKKLAESLEKRKLMLKLLSVNLYDMEENSRFDLLVSFKETCWETVKSFKAVITKFCKDMNGEEIESLSLAFFAYLHGIYPYAYATDYQCRAMDQAGMKYKKQKIYDITKLFFINIFKEEN